MAQIDFSDMQPKRKPTKRERGRYKRWVRYLKNSKLSEADIHSRAAAYTMLGKEPEKD